MSQDMERRIALLLILVLISLTTFFLIWSIPGLFIAIPPYTIGTITARDLKGGSPIGYKLAFVGTLLLIVGQLYSLRKRVRSRWVRRFGRRRRWLTRHCQTDLVATTLILIHSGFPHSFIYANPFEHMRLTLDPRGLVGVAGLATWLVLASAVSGVFGRYLYRRSGARGRGWFSRWRKVHLVLSGSMYVTGTLHLLITVWFKFITG